MATREQQLDYAERVAGIWARRYRVSPVAGRVIGYLLISDPPRQSIDELAGVLRASRSAIAGAVTSLQTLGVVRRGRAAGQRVDRVWAAPIEESKGFDPVPHQEMANLAREGLLLLSDSEPERHRQLEEMASLGDFLAERLPALLAEWRAQRQTTQMAPGQMP